MNQQQEASTQKSTLQELKEIREGIRNQVTGGAPAKGEDLPEGSAPLEAKEEVVAAAPAAPAEEVAPPAPVVEEKETLIRIGDKEFKTQSEAIKYAEKLEYDKLVADGYNQGIRDAMNAAKPPVAEVPEEDNFDEKFYSNPKAVIKEVEEKATQRALAMMQAENRKEQLWSTFLNTYPDIAREDAEMILGKNMDTIGAMTDVEKAMGALATKTRSYYQGIVERTKPRTELPNRSGQVVSTGQMTAPSVTPVKKDEAPLDFIKEMKKLRGRA